MGITKTSSIVLLSSVIVLALGNRAEANSLQQLVPNSVCSPADLQTEPLALRPNLVDGSWAQALGTTEAKSIFDAVRMNSLKGEANAIREQLSSAHVVQELDHQFAALRMKAVKQGQSGQLKPLEEGRNYSRQEFDERRESQADFNQNEVQGTLREAYRFYETVYRQREELRQTAPVKEEANAKLLSAVEAQRKFLNDRLAVSVPTLAAKIGVISPGKLTSLPFSYRDGRIVKIRFSKESSNGRQVKMITVYPRLLINAIQGRDYYFLQALEMFRDYTKAQYETAFEDKISFKGWVAHLMGSTTRDEELRVRREIYRNVEDDLMGAKQVHQVIALLNDREILSLLDLLRELQGSNLPKCGGDIRAMNNKMRRLLGGKASTAAPGFTQKEKTAMDQLAKDIVFFQDIYSSFTEAASIQLAKDASIQVK